jgi:hypothetical protein
MTLATRDVQVRDIVQGRDTIQTLRSLSFVDDREQRGISVCVDEAKFLLGDSLIQNQL